jgi:bifunctional DNA-binding transcriptional regulator/antitoxin component of YhaV-PrlF toxin-antitoxin module
MNKEYKFQAIIVDAGGGGAFVRIPFDVEEAFGKKRVPVHTSIDNVPYRGTLVRMGEPNHILIILKEIRHAIGKNPGDTVEISLREDTEPRVVEIPPDLRQALDQEPLARDAFDKLSYTHQREHVRAILDARREETRQNRIAKTVQMLLQTSKDP